MRAHQHQVADEQDHRVLDRLAVDHQQLEVGFGHQLIHGHIALGVGGLGQLPGIRLGELGVIVRQPMHPAQQATGGGDVITLWISLQVTEEALFGVAQGGLIHMLELRHAVFVEGVGLRLVQ